MTAQEKGTPKGKILPRTSMEDHRTWRTLLTGTVLCLLTLFPGPVDAQEEILSYKITEQSEVGAFVGNVARDSELYSRFTQEEFQQLQYSISSQTSKFTIDEDTSTIRTGQVLDRERECEFNAPSEPCELEFDVGVYKWQEATGLYDLLMIVHVTVVLEDINDNSPMFPSDQVTLSVPESVPIGHVLLLSGAIDRDTGPSNNIQQYHLNPDSGVFRLQVMTSVDGVSSDLGLVVEKTLDREAQSTYRLQVVATDGGFPQRSGSVNITINIQDVNDNAPRFSQSVFNVTVEEDAPVNVAILRLLATDPDSAQNGALSFSFSSRTSQKIRDVLAVDQSTGDVILIQPLDYEKDKRLQFMVEVRDHGSPPQQAQAAVIIHIADVNDNAPQIGITLPPGGTDISESIEIGSFIAHVSLSDADSGANGQISCEVTNKHFRLERFSTTSYIYKILLEQSLDYETARQHQVNVSCVDHGNPPLHNSSVFTIHVRDENDNAPIFTKTQYHISVRENREPGRFVFQLSAMDPDTLENGNVSYSLIDNPQSAFSIDPHYGILRAMRRFDRETRSSYRLVVEAKDRGIPSMTSTAVVLVDIDDVNDSPTHFAQPHFEFTVEEGHPKGTVVDILRVVDLDNVALGQLQFSFLPEFVELGQKGDLGLSQGYVPPPPEFSIDPSTGTITTTRPLDRESPVNVFDFTVFVVDAENVNFNDTATVTVTVTDTNDHAPNISFPTRSNNTVRLAYTAAPGSIIAKIQATDLDEAENGSLTYSIESGDTLDMFFMNGISGELVLARRLQASEATTYPLLISVQDNGRVVQMASRETLNVIVSLSNSTALGFGVNSDHNVAIVVTLVCVTVALALAVLATICIIRRIDRERKHHSSAKMEEQNIYKQETLPPASVEEKSPAMENYENELEKLKRKIKRELSFVGDEDDTGLDSSSVTNGTASFSTFKKTSSGSTVDHKMLSSPQASSSVLQNTLSPEGSSTTGVKRVHYLDKGRDINRLTFDPHPRSTSPSTVSPSGPTWSSHHTRPTTGGLTVAPGEDSGSHTSGSTSDSGRGASSEDDVNSHVGAAMTADAGEEYRLHSPRSYHSNQSLSTFRSPGVGRGDRTLVAGPSDSTLTSSAASGLNSTLPPPTPRSYLQALDQHIYSNVSNNNYSRNISFSDDSVTANTTVDRKAGKPTQASLGKGECYSPRQVQEERERESRERGEAPPSSSSSAYQFHPKSHQSLPHKSQLSKRHAQNQQQQRQRHSPPLPYPTDVSPLEHRHGDDSYGVRGKVVNSYSVTPRRTNSASRLPGLGSSRDESNPSSHGRVRFASAAKAADANRTMPGDKSNDASANTTQDSSSVGQAYSMADVKDVIGDTTLGTTVDEEDRTTTTSGSYTINADDLCNEIDNLFFNDVVV